jgi:hypothetical protein
VGAGGDGVNPPDSVTKIATAAAAMTIRLPTDAAIHPTCQLTFAGGSGGMPYCS